MPETSCDSVDTRVADLSTELLLSCVLSCMWKEPSEGSFTTFHKPFQRFWNQAELFLGDRWHHTPNLSRGKLSLNFPWAVTTKTMSTLGLYEYNTFPHIKHLSLGPKWNFLFYCLFIVNLKDFNEIFLVTAKIMSIKNILISLHQNPSPKQQHNSTHSSFEVIILFLL